MFKSVIVAFFFVAVATTTSEARHSRIVGQAPGCNVTMPCDFSFSQTGRVKTTSYAQRDHGAGSYRREVAAVTAARGQSIGGRPAGCPHSFCGCGASIHVFGRIVPGLISHPTGYGFHEQRQRREWLPRVTATFSS